MNVGTLKSIVYSILTVSALLWAPQSRAQSGSGKDYSQAANDPQAVSAGSKLDYRSRIVPYPSREEALAGNAVSSYVVPVSDWKRDTVPGGLRYSGRFKVRYSWDGRAVIFRIEDVSSSFSVAVNGRDAGYSQNCAGMSEFDITDLIVPDYNDVSVTIYHKTAASLLRGRREAPYPHFREASVVSQPSVRVHDMSVRTSADDRLGYMTLEVITQSTLLNPKTYVVQYELIDPSGKTVAASQKELQTGMLTRDTVRFTATVEDPLKWNHESPNLYTLLVRSQNEGRFLENVAVGIGFRSVSYGGGKLMIDGAPVALSAVRYAANENRSLTGDKLARLKGAGYNCIVADGFPQPGYFYSLCDSLGLYVCNAADIDTSAAPQRITVGGNPSNDPRWENSYRDRIRSMYYSSALHPSVVMLSPARSSLNGYCLYEGYMELKRIAPSVPVFYGEADGEWNNDIDSAYLFRKPAVVPDSPGSVDVSWERTPDGGAVVLENGRTMTSVRGTYRITVKAGLKTLSSAIGDFEIEGGGRRRCPVELPGGNIKKGSVRVEVSAVRSVSGGSGSLNRKVSDLYETTDFKFDL